MSFLLWMHSYQWHLSVLLTHSNTCADLCETAKDAGNFQLSLEKQPPSLHIRAMFQLTKNADDAFVAKAHSGGGGWCADDVIMAL
jgi:hypothetical protein